MKHDVIIVGAGLFGSIAGALARAEGHRVTVVDDARPFRASAASGCVLAPSWLSSLSAEQIDTALGVLQDLYKVQEIEFTSNLLGKKFKAHRIDPRSILRKSDTVGRAMAVGDGWVDVGSTLVGSESVRMRGKVLVAAGVWCGYLVDRLPDIQGQYGCSLLIPGELKEPLINAYAPYKQAVAFQVRPGQVWFGDGSALIEKTWMSERVARIERTKQRAIVALPKTLGKAVTNSAIVTEGARPYVKGHKAGYFERVAKNTWVSTGGAKNGTVLAAWQAAQFVKELR